MKESCCVLFHTPVLLRVCSTESVQAAFEADKLPCRWSLPGRYLNSVGYYNQKSMKMDTNKENEGDSSNQQDLDSLALLQPFWAENSKKRRGGKTPLVETEVRRSDIIKKDNAGFKRGSCSNNKCLPCNAAPPVV